jgi:hypothetical protein
MPATGTLPLVKTPTSGIATIFIGSTPVPVSFSGLLLGPDFGFHAQDQVGAYGVEFTVPANIPPGTYPLFLTVADPGPAQTNLETSNAISLTVIAPSMALTNIMSTIASFELASGGTNSLDSQLKAVIRDLGDPATAASDLQDFINHVTDICPPAGNKLTAAQANTLIVQAKRILSTL